jgi:rfaE bifunctional protein nucleotidyltransferase chain/domain/rfaE bifunctional protein kinase chain/domain
MSGPLVIVGDALLDRDLEGVAERLCPEAPVPVVEDVTGRSRPGGAALAAALAAGDGLEVTLLTALGADAPGRELARLLAEAGVDVVDLGLDGPTQQKVRVIAGGRVLLRLDHGGRARAAIGVPAGEARAALRWAGAILVADYGRGVAEQAHLRAALADLAFRVPIVWDPHPRGGEPAPGIRLATPNRAELAGLVPDEHGDRRAAAAGAHALLERWRAGALAVTLGAGGALLVEAGAAPVHVRAPRIAGGDPCGAGDRFAVTATTALAAGAQACEAVSEAVRAASAFVAEGGAGAFRARVAAAATAHPRPNEAHALVERIRAAGGTVAATGGCFDLLHAGHVSTLDAARALGDCLVVLLNSDESVRRLKGPGRPVVPECDRAAVLQALEAVDAIVVFDEDTPERALERLRPDVFAKGGDYTVAELPEARLLERWGGRAVVLPYIDGRSTSGLIREARARDAV